MNIHNVLVVGAGTMGAGIAQWFCQNEVKVTLADVKAEQLQVASNNIFTSWDLLVQKNKITSEQNKDYRDNLKTASLSNIDINYDLVIEAIFENLAIKLDLFKTLDAKINSNCIFATNTSSFQMKLFLSELSERRKLNFLGLHFFNPAPIMKLVEIIKSESTDDSLSQKLYQWFEAKGKKPAICSDSPGFIVNRVARNFYGEALRIVETEDIDHMKLIDHVMREVGTFKMGPFELMDMIGIDINLDVTKSVHAAFQMHDRFAPHHLQEQMVQEKRFGKKTKRGFYDY
jgi:3-hydroxybutyryl-CoA dehydrogenase